MRLLRYAPSDSSTYFKYASGVLGRKSCIHIRLDLFATNPCEKCRLTLPVGKGRSTCHVPNHAMHFLHSLEAAPA